jgi:hypothetical protein
VVSTQSTTRYGMRVFFFFFFLQVGVSLQGKFRNQGMVGRETVLCSQLLITVN